MESKAKAKTKQCCSNKFITCISARDKNPVNNTAEINLKECHVTKQSEFLHFITETHFVQTFSTSRLYPS